MTKETTSKQVQIEIDSCMDHIKRLADLRDKYVKEEEAAQRRP
jgi:hypothetical protein